MRLLLGGMRASGADTASACLQEEQITKNILKSWDVQRSMHAEVKRVLEVAKRKKRSERVVRMVDAAARGHIEEVGGDGPGDKRRAFPHLRKPQEEHLVDAVTKGTKEVKRLMNYGKALLMTGLAASPGPYEEAG